MKNIMLCGRPSCCPSIKEDKENGIMYIVDGKMKIPFNDEQVKSLTKYLNKR